MEKSIRSDESNG